MTEQDITPPQTINARLLALAKKPVVWIAGLVVVGVGAAVSDTVKDALISSLPEYGAPVTVDLARAHNDDPMHLGFDSEVYFSDQEAMTMHQRGEGSWDHLVSRGAAPVGYTRIQVAVTGNRRDGVRIMNLIADKDCSAPYTGAFFYDVGGSGMPSIELDIDLDKNQPQAMDSGAEPDATPYFKAGTVNLKEGEQDIFEITATTAESYCSFTLEMTVLDDGELQVLRIDNQGKPFEVTADLSPERWDQYFVGIMLCDKARAGYAPVTDEWKQGDRKAPVC